MYRGFNIEIKDKEPFSNYYSIGRTEFDSAKKIAKDNLSNYIGKDRAVNGKKLTEDWFPQIEADIFISHSHSNEKLAIAIAGFLFKNFGLKSFIDSLVWEYSDDLLKDIDNRWCYNEKKGTYDYQQRNRSTSYIHMMLNGALAKMIDKCECMFFLNTPDSIIPSDVINETYSPWIYSEVLLSKLIEKKVPQRIIDLHESKSTNEIKKGRTFSELKIKLEADLRDFTDLDSSGLEKWEQRFTRINNPFSNSMRSLNQHSLDVLYNLFPLQKNDTITRFF